MSGELDPTIAPPRRRDRDGRRRAADLLLGAAGAAVLVVLWQVLSTRLGPIRMPSPGDTLTAVVDNFRASPVIEAQGGGEDGLAAHLWATIVRTFVGVAVGGAAGIGLGLLLFALRPIRLVLQPPIETLRLTPSLVAAPFLVLWFGVSATAQIGLVAVYSLVTMQLYAFSAAQAVSVDHARFAATLGASRLRILRTVLLPAILPELIGGLRAVLQLSWGLEVIAGFIGAQRDIGFVMSSMAQIYRTDLIFAAVIVLAITAIVADALLRIATYRATRWHVGSGQQAL